MTILTGYTPTEASRAALDKALELGALTQENVVVINAGPGGEHKHDSSLSEDDKKVLDSVLDAAPVATEYREYARGRSTLQEFKDICDELDPTVVVLGSRRRSGFSKFAMGSITDDLLKELDPPILCVKAIQKVATKNDDSPQPADAGADAAASSDTDAENVSAESSES